MMKKALSLRTQLFGLMLLLVVLQSIALVVALSISQVFYMLDAEALRLLESTNANQVESYNMNVGQLVSSMAGEVEDLEARLYKLASGGNIDVEEIYLNDELYLEASMCAAQTVLGVLEKNTVSGAFVILNGANGNKTDPMAHSAVYIRDSAPTRKVKDDGNYLLEYGPTHLPRELGIATSIGWELHFTLTSELGIYAPYSKPIEAARTIQGAETERYGYWNPPVDAFGDGHTGVMFTLPLRNSNGEPYGVVGIDISLTLFNQHYLPNNELPYENSFLAIVPEVEDKIGLDWFIPSNPIAHAYLGQSSELSIQTEKNSNLYRTEIAGLGEMYCSSDELNIYSKNSPFVDERWHLISMVPQTVLHETSRSVRGVLISSIAITTVISALAIFFLLHITTRKIVGLSSHIQSISGLNNNFHFERTGIREIDELTTAVETLNTSVISASKTTSKILELTLLPIGGYELMNGNSHVTLTEYVYELLDIQPGTPVTRAQWDQYYQSLTQELAKGYEDVYDVTCPGKGTKWLRIYQAPTPNGIVGVIQDVSDEVEEHRRLAKELDYDPMTRLLNRGAFKRLADNRLQAEPNKVGAVIFADLDNLKYINDTYGHNCGDVLIERAGEMFRAFEQYGGIVSRISGDEFAIFLHGFREKEEIRECIRMLNPYFSTYSIELPSGVAQKVRYSTGVAYYPDDGDNIMELMKRSDFAMYEAKSSQRGSLYEFNATAYQNKMYLLENREAINRLLDEELIQFAFQPIVDVRTGQIFAYEALMRPLLNTLHSPLEILKVAAAQSKLAQLERLVIMKAFRCAFEEQETLGDIKLFVNSIPNYVLCDEDHDFLVQNYSRVFKNIVVEITEEENGLNHQMEKKAKFIADNGLGLAVDDYGAGYANEVRVLAMNPQIIKIDMELVSGISKSVDKQFLVSNLISFCHAKGIKLVAEGVENSEDLAKLVRLGVDYVQGYYIRRPQFSFSSIPEDIVAELLDLQK